MIQTVWVIFKSEPVLLRQEAGDCIYNSEIFEIFARATIAEYTLQFLTAKSRSENSNTTWSLRSFSISEQISNDVSRFIEHQVRKSNLAAEIAATKEKLKALQEEAASVVSTF